MTDTVQVVEIRLDAIKDPAIFRAMLVPEGETAPALQAQAARTGYAAWGPSGTLIAATVPVIATSDGSITSVTTTSAMAALSGPVVGALVFLVDGDRSGAFETKAGNAPAGDPLQGLTIQSAAGAFHYARQWDGINGRAEWFGAVVGDSGAATTNTAAIQACLDLCPVTRLGGGSYYTDDTLTILKNGTVVRGVTHTQTDQSGNDASPPRQTQITCTSASATILRIGDAGTSAPATLTETCKLLDFTVNRSVNPFTAASGLVGAIGIDCRWMVNCHFERVFSLNSAMGWRFYGTVENYVTRCGALRDKEGSNPANDTFVGFYGDYTAPAPFNGGNASLYFTQCRVFPVTGNAAPSLTYSAGFRTDGGFVDLYLNGNETGSSIQYGAHFVGTGSSEVDVKTEDLILRGNIFDASTIAALKIEQSGPQTQITVANGYMVASGATAVILSNVGGNVFIEGNQIDYGTVPSSGTGIAADNCSNIYCLNNQHTNIKNPINFNNVTTFKITDLIHSVDDSGTNTYPAINIVGSSKSGVIAPMISGPAGAYASGVKFADAGQQLIEINVSGIEIGSVTSKKIDNNGTTISTAGSFGTNCLAAGIFA